MSDLLLTHNGFIGEAVEGYENLFKTSNENIAKTCFPVNFSGYGIEGSFFIGSVAQFELGNQTFTGKSPLYYASFLYFYAHQNVHFFDVDSCFGWVWKIS